MKVYLDNAATTPIDPQVIEVMTHVMKNCYGNPSSIHSYGVEARAIIERSRKSIAGLLNVSPSELFFTSGGTEANNMALYCSVRDLGIKHVITSKIEHHAVLHTLENLQKQGKIKVSFVKLSEDAHVDLNDLEKLLSENPKTLVSLMHANNEVGNLLPLKTVSELCRQYDAIFHSDTVQTIGHFKHDFQQIKLDFASCSAHKFHGPKGIGFLYINNRIHIQPLLFGGSQERNMRGGTENIYGIAGLAKAFEISQQHVEKHQQHISQIKKYMIEKLKSAIPGVSFNGDYANSSLFTILNVSLPPTDVSEMLLFKLDIDGVAASGGSACSSGSSIGSHVLNALHTPENRPAVRFSFSKYTTKDEIDFCVEKLSAIFKVTEKI